MSAERNYALISAPLLVITITLEIFKMKDTSTGAAGKFNRVLIPLA
jgi:hypothetical protein